MFCLETQGIEWDFFACDRDGHVALVSSGGSGQVPPFLLAHEADIEQLMEFLGVRFDGNAWDQAARRGFFAYDVNINGGPFWREASPKQPIRLDELPDPHRRLIQRVTVKGCFRWLWRLRPSRFEF